MALGYAWFDSYDSAGYVLTLHIFPPSAIEAYVWGMYGGHFLCRVANLRSLGIIEDSCLEVHAA
eukprot:COSAG05_NODE_2187_length_3425_cov_3.315995_4_plen_64_part_00